MGNSLKIAITAGEPAGIGYDLCAMLRASDYAAKLTVFADYDALYQRAAALNILPSFLKNCKKNDQSAQAHAGKQILIKHQSCPQKVQPGQLNPANAPYVLARLQQACAECLRGNYHALVTAPMHKGVVNQAGIEFSGHTEQLGAWCAEHYPATPVMMLACAKFKVALATTHLPLKDVAATINRTSLERNMRILYRDLQTKFAIKKPRIIVLGLNPHAGEGGYLGTEEIEIIAPVVDKLNSEGMNFSLPMPADSAFLAHNLAQQDAIFGMYHDQVLPTLKYAGFNSAVNITLGLPIIRTSVDHGTALDLAASGKIETGSMQAAIKMAITMAAAMRRR